VYRAIKESDGTYTIRYSTYGGNYEIIKTGVRGCNVKRIIDKLVWEDYFAKGHF
jgi:hypothetical protein